MTYWLKQLALGALFSALMGWGAYTLHNAWHDGDVAFGTTVGYMAFGWIIAIPLWNAWEGRK